MYAFFFYYCLRYLCQIIKFSHCYSHILFSNDISFVSFLSTTSLLMSHYFRFSNTISQVGFLHFHQFIFPFLISVCFYLPSPPIVSTTYSSLFISLLGEAAVCIGLQLACWLVGWLVIRIGTFPSVWRLHAEATECFITNPMLSPIHTVFSMLSFSSVCCCPSSYHSLCF